MSTSTSLDLRVDASVTTGAVAMVDLVAIAAFVYVGELQHNFPPSSYPLRYLGTLAPFLVSWVALALVAGLYSVDARRRSRWALTRAVPAWLLTVLVVQVIRATPPLPGNASLVFASVAFLIGGLFLLSGRVLTTVVLGGN